MSAEGGPSRIRVLNASTMEAVGAIEAQQAIERVHGGALVEVAWMNFVELAAAHGWRSPACRAFVSELVKRTG